MYRFQQNVKYYDAYQGVHIVTPHVDEEYQVSQMLLGVLEAIQHTVDTTVVVVYIVKWVNIYILTMKFLQ